MPLLRRVTASLFLSSLLWAQTPPEDPVVKARNQRGQTSSNPGDLPPVPRTVMEPPPLPPPEAHHKDLRKAAPKKGKGTKTKAAPAKTGKAKAAKPVRTKKRK